MPRATPEQRDKLWRLLGSAMPSRAEKRFLHALAQLITVSRHGLAVSPDDAAYLEELYLLYERHLAPARKTVSRPFGLRLPWRPTRGE